jgi:hypothetical protein
MLTMLRILTPVVALLLLPAFALAHCDTLDGPVVLDAKAALDGGDVTPVLKWVRAADEGEIRAAFDQALQVRKLGPPARDLADRYFFETLVRVHRAGEGAPYTGLKPAGGEVEPAVAAADKALQTGSDKALVDLVTDAARTGLHERFTRTRQLREHAGHNVAAGREYVAAYVDFVHYAEALHQTATRAAAEHHAAPAAGHEH